METEPGQKKHLFTNKQLWALLVPVVVEQILNSLMGTADTMMVSNVGSAAISAVSLVDSINVLVIQVFAALAAGGTIICSQYMGQKNTKNATDAAKQLIFIITAIAVVLTVVCVVFQIPLLHLIFGKVEAEVMINSEIYFLYTALSFPFIAVFNAGSSVFRAQENTRLPMTISVISNIMNIVGNAILINGWFGMPQLGAVGAAISTDISKLVGLALMIGMFFKSRRVKMGMSYLRPFPVQILKNLCLLAIPTGVESFSYNLSQMIILGIVNSFGTLVTVTKGYCTIFANIDYVYAMAIATATQIVLGYLIGARRLNDIQKRVNATLKVAIAACVGMAVLMCLGGKYIFLIFTDNPEIIALGRRILVIEIVLEIGRAVNIVMTKCLIAVGDVLTPTTVGITFQWVVAAAGSWLLGSKLGWGLEGVWIAMAADECVRGLIYAVHFKKERWKKNFKGVKTEAELGEA